MTDPRHPRIRNVNEVAPVESQHGTRFGATRRRLGAEAGGQELGCSWYELAPGRRAFPHHFHFGNEEALFVLSGTGELRLGEGRYPVRAGDYVAMPAGPEGAHSLENTGTEPLRYLGLSTARSTDVVVYPDSKKFSAVGGANTHQGLKNAPFFKLLREQPNVDYYLDEE